MDFRKLNNTSWVKFVTTGVRWMYVEPFQKKVECPEDMELEDIYSWHTDFRCHFVNREHLKTMIMTIMNAFENLIVLRIIDGSIYLAAQALCEVAINVTQIVKDVDFIRTVQSWLKENYVYLQEGWEWKGNESQREEEFVKTKDNYVKSLMKYGINSLKVTQYLTMTTPFEVCFNSNFFFLSFFLNLQTFFQQIEPICTFI